MFGAIIQARIRRLPVHRSMAEVSELIYETQDLHVHAGQVPADPGGVRRGHHHFGWVQQMNVAEVLLILASR